MVFGCDTMFSNNVLADNRADLFGSGAMMYYSPHSRWINNTIARNTEGDGSGLLLAYPAMSQNIAVLTNTVLISHTYGISITEGNTVTLEATLWGNETDWGGAGKRRWLGQGMEQGRVTLAGGIEG